MPHGGWLGLSPDSLGVESPLPSEGVELELVGLELVLLELEVEGGLGVVVVFDSWPADPVAAGSDDLGCSSSSCSCELAGEAGDPPCDFELALDDVSEGVDPPEGEP